VSAARSNASARLWRARLRSPRSLIVAHAALAACSTLSYFRSHPSSSSSHIPAWFGVCVGLPRGGASRRLRVVLTGFSLQLEFAPGTRAFVNVSFGTTHSMPLTPDAPPPPSIHHASRTRRDT
jgi:hypothetical protein